MVKVYNWNLKLWAVIAAVIIILAAIGFAIGNGNRTDDTAITVGIANREGSGVIGTDFEMVRINSKDVAEFVPEKWKGKIVATPGAASIQEILIKSEMKKIGLDCVSYQPGQPANPDKVNIWSCTNLETLKDVVKTKKVDAAIIWEPWYSDLATGDFKKLCTTGEMEGQKDHLCCLISANSGYIKNHPEEVVRFLAGYNDTVNWINEAKKPTSDNHEKLVEMASNYLGISDRNVVEPALENIKFTNDTNNLKESYSDLIVKLGDYLKKKISPADADRFASSHVDLKPMENAKKIEKKPYSKATVKIGVIAQDMHHLALYIGKELGFFSEYGIDVQTSVYDNGAKIMTGLISGEMNMGFAGASPTVMYVVNMS